jgi:hypothetical protein
MTRNERWALIITAVIGISGCVVAFASYLNTKAARFDAFDLDIFKLQVDAGATLVTLVDQEIDVAKRLMENSAKACAFLEKVMSKRNRVAGEAARMAELSQIQPVVQQLSTDLTGLTTGREAVQKSANSFLLVIPSDVGKALTDAIPHPRVPQDLTGHMVQVMVAFGSQDAAALMQADQSMVAIRDQSSILQQGFQVEEQKWNTAKTQFLCAMQVSRQQHAPLSVVPRDCGA